MTLKTGEIAAIMGPNGTGKSTLSAAIMGNPNYEITEGDILFDGESILDLEVDERARLGLFLAMQYPAEIPGITNAEFIRAAMNAGKEDDEKISVLDFITKLDEKMELLGMREEMAERYLNEGFSGGEKKRNEILQLLMLEPKFALLDEIDSGLDIDALKVVSKGVNAMRGEGFGAMIITHYQRLLNYITPDVVHVMMEGKVVLSGGPELAARLEQEGYAKIAEELGYEYLCQKNLLSLFHKQKQSHFGCKTFVKQPLISLKVWLFQKLSVLNSTVGISVMERLLKMNHQQMCLILQRLETTLNWSK